MKGGNVCQAKRKESSEGTTEQWLFTLHLELNKENDEKQLENEDDEKEQIRQEEAVLGTKVLLVKKKLKEIADAKQITDTKNHHLLIYQARH